MRRRSAVLLSGSLFLVAACSQETDVLAPLGEGPAAPEGTPEVTEAVDGLTVGHRAMEAGLYENALKAYLRAASEQGLTADVLSAMGSANLKLGRLGQAERLLRLAVEKDERFAPAWNNLGVVLMERDEVGEAVRVFKIAFGLDSGESADIKQNLTLALAKLEDRAYDQGTEKDFELVRSGSGQYELLRTPGSGNEQ